MNSLTEPFDLAIKSNADGKIKFEARCVFGGHRDKLKNYVVHGAQTLQDSSSPPISSTFRLPISNESIPNQLNGLSYFFSLRILNQNSNWIHQNALSYSDHSTGCEMMVICGTNRSTNNSHRNSTWCHRKLILPCTSPFRTTAFVESTDQTLMAYCAGTARFKWLSRKRMCDSTKMVMYNSR